MLIRKENWNIKKGILIRAYMPIGFYPAKTFSIPNSAFVIGDDLIFSAVQFNEVEKDYYIEREWLKPEEIKLLAALALAVPTDSGKIYAYPHPLSFKIKDENYNLSNTDVLKQIKANLIVRLKKEKNSSFWHSVNLPAIMGGPDYKFNENAYSLNRQNEIFELTHINDHLLIRGLGAFLKGDLLSVHHIFHTEACISMHIAMEATLQIILRRLKKTMQNPSNKDASIYLGEKFNSKYIPEKYFEDYYSDRILAVHPSNRFGTFPDAPLCSDDFYDLYEDLKTVYDFLITGNIQTNYEE